MMIAHIQAWDKAFLNFCDIFEAYWDGLATRPAQDHSCVEYLASE